MYSYTWYDRWRRLAGRWQGNLESALGGEEESQHFHVKKQCAGRGGGEITKLRWIITTLRLNGKFVQNVRVSIFKFSILKGTE